MTNIRFMSAYYTLMPRMKSNGPYPDKFMNPMAGSYGIYPRLRSWTLGVNLSF